jgi:hypothetical protein
MSIRTIATQELPPLEPTRGIGGFLFGILIASLACSLFLITIFPQLPNVNPILKLAVLDIPNQPQRSRAQITKLTATYGSTSTGEAAQNISVFSATQEKIMVVAELYAIPPGSKIEYIRYLNDKYLDSKSATITKVRPRYFSFDWTLQDRQKRHATGTYEVKMYLNGTYMRSVTFQVVD